MAAATIFAPATARGRAGVAVVRLSGPSSWTAVERLAGRLPEPRRAALRVLRDAEGERIDEALVLLFEEGRSFTGEQSAELQVHGSAAVIDAVTESLRVLPDLRLARPGEFARRALVNGRISLPELEGLGDLIEAETREQRRQATRLLEGRLGAAAAGWREKLVQAMALLTAAIDFADEDIPEEVGAEAAALVREVRVALEAESRGSRVAERLRDGFEVAIVGPPNAGKSTLLNYIARRPVALTSDVAGTTRDVIEVRLDLDGLPVTLLDTAGLREAEEQIEAAGVALAVSRAQAADLRVFLRDGDAEIPAWVEDGDIVVAGKADEVGSGVSGLTGRGVEPLLNTIRQRLDLRAGKVGSATNARHREALDRGTEGLRDAEAELSAGRVELAAEGIRVALQALDRLVGAVGVEDVLDRVFASFCLGK